jgi:hypothetical protein
MSERDVRFFEDVYETNRFFTLDVDEDTWNKYNINDRVSIIHIEKIGMKDLFRNKDREWLVYQKILDEDLITGFKNYKIVMVYVGDEE